MNKTKISYVDMTWSPVTGCSKLSLGCQNCYADRWTREMRARGIRKYAQGFRVAVHDQALQEPARVLSPNRVLVNSMSDTFHDEVPDDFIRRMFSVMRDASQHTFLILTKRAERLEELGRHLDWADNIWAGVTVEARRYLYRLDHLRRTPAQYRWVSFEPLLETLGDIDLAGIDFAVVGGESGPGSRPMERQWATEIRDQCLDAGTIFNFKQWSGTNKKAVGRLLDGRTWDEMPVWPTDRAHQDEARGQITLPW